MPHQSRTGVADDAEVRLIAFAAHSRIPPLAIPSGHRRHLLGRVLIALLLCLVFSVGLYENRAWLTLAEPSADATTASGAAELADGDASPALTRIARRHPEPPDPEPARFFAHRLARADAPPPGGLRQRLIANPGPPPFDSDRAMVPLPVDESLFAMAARPPLLTSPYDPGLGYRLSEERRFFRPGRILALSDRLPLVWMHAGPVPEPDSWVLMIAGLGLIGTMLRLRRHIAHPSHAVLREPI